jgi:hypothetical protein
MLDENAGLLNHQPINGPAQQATKNPAAVACDGVDFKRSSQT